MVFYGVKIGRKAGVYRTWEEVEEQTLCFPNAEFRKFESKEDAENFVGGKDESKGVVEYKKRDKEAIRHSKEADTLSIYTDGSYQDGNYYGGYLIIDDGEIVKRDITIGADNEFAKQRNIAGELSAIKESLNYVHEEYENLAAVYIYSDLEGAVCWARLEGGWKKNNKYTKGYFDFIKAKREFFDIEIQFVKGGNGDPFNEEADRLADLAFKKDSKLKKRESIRERIEEIKDTIFDKWGSKDKLSAGQEYELNDLDSESYKNLLAEDILMQINALDESRDITEKGIPENEIFLMEAYGDLGVELSREYNQLTFKVGDLNREISQLKDQIS